MFLCFGLEPSCRVLRFFLNLCVYVYKYQKQYKHFQSYIEFDFIKDRILFVLGLGLRFLSKINIFVTNLHLTYQSARLWCPSSLIYFTFVSDLFVSCLLRIQIQKRSYSFLDRIVSSGLSSFSLSFLYINTGNDIPSQFSFFVLLLPCLPCIYGYKHHLFDWSIDQWVSMLET